MRAEGITELASDLVIFCTGGTPLANGAPIPQANITVVLNTQVTSRLLGSGGVTNASEALLLIDEPNTGLAGYGPSVPMTICAAPATGCAESIGNTSAPLNGVNVPVIPGTSNPGPNVFQGVVNPDGVSITFFGVPVAPVGTAGADRIFRITNLRINASGVPAKVNPGVVVAAISMSGAGSLPLTQSQVTAAFVAPGLTAASSSGTVLNQCSSGPGMFVGRLKYLGNFGTAFKTRVLANAANDGLSGQSAAGNQSVPGSANNTVSESGLILNGIPASFGTGGSIPTLAGGNAIAGLADYGTRFRAVFHNIPSGVSIYVSTVNMVPGTLTPATAPAATSTSSSFAQLIVSDTAPENGASVPALAATGSNGGVRIAALPVVNGSATAVWEVTNSATSATQDFEFPVYLSCRGMPVAASQITYNQSYGPIGSTSGTVLATSTNIPRFIDPGTYDNQVLASFIPLVSLHVATPPLGTETVGVPVKITFTGEGGVAPYTLQVSGLPTGLTSTKGVVTGSPTTAGPYTITVTVTDATQATSTRTFKVTVNAPPLTVTTRSLPVGVPNVAYSVLLGAAGGTQPYTWSATGVPAGFNLSSTGTLSGTATAPGSSSLRVTVTDHAGLTASETYTLKFALPPLPSLTFTGLGTTMAPASQAVLQLTLGAAYPLPITANLSLAFVGAAGADDPADQFSSGGRQVQLTIPAGATVSTSSVGVQAGTLAGTMTITAQLVAGGASITPTPAPSHTLRIQSSAPKISSVRVQRTDGGLRVTVTGYATSRRIARATFTFVAAHGAGAGNPSVTMTVEPQFSGWYTSGTSAGFGGAFAFTQEFSLSPWQGGIAPLAQGPAPDQEKHGQPLILRSDDPVGSVSVTLTNADGTSTPVSATVR